MIIPADIHTHRLPEAQGTAIVNCYPEEFHPQQGQWYSVGIHPWHLTSSVVEREHQLRQWANHPQVLALGEAGLDKLAAEPLSLQIPVFESQARLSMEVDKPLIIHLVKATDELLKLRQALRPTNPWIIHGFRGKATLAAEYLRAGFYLSFGEKYQEEALRVTPIDRLFMETDESSMSVAELYVRASAIRGASSKELQKALSGNVRKTFFKR